MKSYYQPSNTQPQPQWPRIMISDNEIIVLFQKPGIGTVIHKPAESSHNIGGYVTYFDMSKFKDFFGSVTIVS